MQTMQLAAALFAYESVSVSICVHLGDIVYLDRLNIYNQNKPKFKNRFKVNKKKK